MAVSFSPGRVVRVNLVTSPVHGQLTVCMDEWLNVLFPVDRVVQFFMESAIDGSEAPWT